MLGWVVRSRCGWMGGVVVLWGVGGWCDGVVGSGWVGVKD